MLAEIYATVRRETMHWLDPDYFRSSDFSRDSQGEDILVARSAADEILGFVSVWAPDAFIHMLYVRREWRGMGVGKALLAALPGWPERSYRLKCLTRSTEARLFYLCQGFVATGCGTSPEGDYEELTRLRIA
nr:GNAT family N-acetyltransferase [uncultured Roseococcus sp.]